MKLLKLKFKMHKLVNSIFYLIIFGIGFLLGFCGNKLNFNKLVSNFLMIDSVQALSIDGDLIYNELILKAEDFNYNEYPYFICAYSSPMLKCRFFTESDYILTSFVNYTLKIGNPTNVYYLEYNTTVNTLSSSIKNFYNFAYTSGIYTNFTNTDNYTGTVQFIDLSEYLVPEEESNEIKFQPLTRDTMFYHIAKNIVGDLDPESYYIYDVVTVVLILSGFLIIIVPISLIFKKIIGG